MFELDPAVRDNVVAWEGEKGRSWLEGLPALVSQLAERWQLSWFGPPLPGGSHSYVATVRWPRGDAVLKVPLLGDENRLEAEALRLYGGSGAVRLLEGDPGSGALLVERCSPGVPLSEHPNREEAIGIACGILRRLWREPPADHAFILAVDKAARWAIDLPERMANLGGPDSLQPLVDAAADLAGEFAHDAGTAVLVNRDAHLGNFLAAEREPWLLIDPKPLVGDPAFDAGYLVADLAGPVPRRREVERIVWRLSDGLGVEQERVRAWALIRAVENILWSLGLGQDPASEIVLAEALLGMAVQT